MAMSIRMIAPAARMSTLCMALSLLAGPALGTPYFFSTGNPDGLIATGSRPDSANKIEIETADDFILTQQTSITSATFTGLLSDGISLSDIGEVRVEIYRVFPLDSSPASGNVLTRVNSPSDVGFDDRDTAAGSLSFSTSTLANSFTANNSVVEGINKSPNQHTGGEGPVTGQEVEFDVTFTTPFNLAPNHYFFVPQVEITDPKGNFYWLSAPLPITGGTGPIVPDLQSWIRNANLDPDWSRIGTDIVGAGQSGPAPKLNAAFSLTGQTGTVPEPASMFLVGIGLGSLWWRRRRSA